MNYCASASQYIKNFIIKFLVIVLTTTIFLINTRSVYAALDSFSIDTVGGQVAGQPFLITIRALDGASNPETSFNSTVNITDDTATITPTGTSAFTNGVWSGTVVITEADISNIISVNTGPYTGQSNSFAISANGGVKIVKVTAGNNQTGVVANTLGTALRVTVVDPYNNPLSSVGVNWAITSYPVGASGQSLGSSSGTTNSSGITTTALTLGNKAGTYIVNASVTSGAANNAHFYETATAGTLTYITVSPVWAILPAGNNIVFSATGYDTYNNAVTLSSPTWSITNGGGSIDSAGLFSGGSTPGTYLNTVRVTSGAVGGTASVTLVDEGGGGSSGTPTPTPTPSNTPTPTPSPSNTPTPSPSPTPSPTSTPTPTPTSAAGVLDSINIDPDIISALEGATIPIVAEGVDVYGSSVTGVNYEFDIEGNLGVLSEAAGNTVLLTASETGIGTLTVTATQGTVSRVAKVVGSVGTGLNRRLIIEEIESPQVVGEPFLISIAAKNSLNEQITDYTGPLAISDTTGTIDPAVASPSAEGLWYVQGIISLAHPEVVISVAGDGMVGVSNVFEVEGDLKLKDIPPGGGGQGAGAGGGGGLGDIKGASSSAEILEKLFKTEGLDRFSVLRYIGAGLAAGFGILGASVGGGLMASRGLEAIGRNPFAKGRLQFNLYASIGAFILAAILAVAAAFIIVR